MHFARKVFGKSPFLPGSGPAICRGTLWLWFRCKLGLAGFELFQLEFKLLDLPFHLLRAASELHASQLRDQQLHPLDLAPVREQLGVLRTDHRLQRCGIEKLQIR